MKIGLLSGIGPLAGADVLSRIIAYSAHHYHAVEDNDYPDIVLLSHGIPEVGNQASLSDTFRDSVVATMNQLQDNGATILGMACNTAYVYLNDVALQPGVSVVDLIDEVAKHAASTQKKHLLLTSHSSRQQKLYHTYLDNHQATYDEVNDTTQIQLDRIIEKVMAHSLSEAGAIIKQILDTAEQTGYESVIVACTELPIAIDASGYKGDLEIIHSNQILAERLVDTYYKST